MFSISYYVQHLDAAGIHTPGMDKAREVLARKLVPDDESARITGELAQALADGTVTPAEVAERAAVLAARSTSVWSAIVQQARAIQQGQARQALADDATAIDRELRARERAATDAAEKSSKVLRKAGAFTADEAVELGPDVAAAWAQRASARKTLDELAKLRTGLQNAQILPAPAKPTVGERIRKFAGID